jgi:hypothetical protein
MFFKYFFWGALSAEAGTSLELVELNLYYCFY